MSFELGVYAVLALLAVAALWLVFSTLSGWLALAWSWLPGHGDRVIVVRVVDGDTVVLRSPKLWGQDGQSCRINDIDAPDEGARKARATAILRRFLPRGCRVRIVQHGDDRYGRPVVDVYRGSRSVANHMRHRMAAVSWDGKGRSPLKRWTLARLLVGR